MKDNYIKKIKKMLQKELNLTFDRSSELLDMYTLLVLVKGENCTNENVHDAWSVWQNNIEPNHRSLIPFDKLSKNVQKLDTQYRDVIIKIARKL